MPRLLLLAGAAWTLPNTVLGLVLGGLGLLAGARACRGPGAIHFLDHPGLRVTPAAAIVLGQCVLFGPGVDPGAPVRCYDRSDRVRLGDHERAHVRQYLLWGPLFLPVYALLALWPGIHPLERQADRWAPRYGGGSASTITSCGNRSSSIVVSSTTTAPDPRKL